MKVTLFSLVLLALFGNTVRAYSQTQGLVHILMNKVWPMENPVETYRYYDFPFCQPPSIEEADMSFGQILRGDRLTNSLYRMTLRQPINNVVVCEKPVSAAEVSLFMSAIRNQYLYEMYIGDLPVVIPFGSSPRTGQFNLCTHLKFEIGFNRVGVVSGNAVCEGETELSHTSTTRLSFSYSVDWISRPELDEEDAWWMQQSQLTNMMSFLKTGKQAVMTASARTATGSLDIHWISILNSLILALLIFSLVLIILVRIVRADLAKYLPSNDMEAVGGFPDGHHLDDDNGASWKLLHGDVFRPPNHRMWLCAAVGAGVQLLFVCATIVLLGAMGVMYYKRGALVSTAVVLYMLSAAISGYISARLYHRIGGVKWKWNMIVTALFFTGPAFVIWAILNTVAISYNSTAALPFLTILQLFAMWGLVTIPLTVIGGIFGRHQAFRKVKANPYPVKTNRLAREIPPLTRWVFTWGFQIGVCGFLSFWSVYLELKYIFKSVWSEGQLYTLYGILVVAMLLLFLLSTILTVLFTYFHLNAEDWRWWWRAFVSGGSVSLFFFGYAVYFYLNSSMSGGLQSAFFFLYSVLIAYGVGLMIGATSFATTYQFVWFIYKQVKSD